MKKSVFALMACAAFAAAASLAHHVGIFLMDAYGYAKSLARHVVDVISPARAESHMPKIPLVQAKAFMQRIVKRERPVITGSWRLCPGV